MERKKTRAARKPPAPRRTPAAPPQRREHTGSDLASETGLGDFMDPAGGGLSATDGRFPEPALGPVVTVRDAVQAMHADISAKLEAANARLDRMIDLLEQLVRC